MAVQDEEAWFDSNRAYIASQYRGQYVVIKDHAVRGGYPDFKSALAAAVNSFGPYGGFAIKLAVPEELIQRIGPTEGPSLGQGRVDRLVEQGPLLRVEVSNPAGGGTPQGVTGVVDTGASISAVRPASAHAAGLIQTGSASIGGVTGTERRPIYAGAVHLPEYNVSFDAVELAGIDLPQAEISFLLGRDLLAKNSLLLTYRGSEGEFSLSEKSDYTLLAVGGGVAAAGVAVLFLTGVIK